MKSTQINSKVLESFSIQDFIRYLEYLSGWSKAIYKSGWVVFESDGTVAPLNVEIVLPESDNLVASPTYKATALSLLSDLREEDPELLAKSIDDYESDHFYVRNILTADSDSIELDVAAKQLQDLKNLVQQATDMEIRNVPYDISGRTSDAAFQINHYRFGHTFRGSFGFTLKAPLLTESEKALQRPFDAVMPERKSPMSRRVLERIAIGLTLANQSADAGSSDFLVDNYQTGFNANMCSSLVSVSGDEQRPVEYRIFWSPVLPTRLEVRDFHPVLIDEDKLVYLKNAGSKLKDLEKPKSVQARGYVKEMNTTDDPLGNIANRTIQLRWLNPIRGKGPTTLTLNVDAESYQLAHAANIDWTKIMLVEGDAKFVRGKGWFLENPRNFRLEEVNE